MEVVGGHQPHHLSVNHLFKTFKPQSFATKWKGRRYTLRISVAMCGPGVWLVKIEISGSPLIWKFTELVDMTSQNLLYSFSVDLAMEISNISQAHSSLSVCLQPARSLMTQDVNVSIVERQHRGRPFLARIKPLSRSFCDVDLPFQLSLRLRAHHSVKCSFT